jgi:hypothetical protein
MEAITGFNKKRNQQKTAKMIDWHDRSLEK